MSNRIICALIIFVLSSASLAKNSLPYKGDQIIVRFAPQKTGIKKTAVDKNYILSSVDVGNVKESLEFVPGLTVVKLPPNLSVEEAISRLKNNPDILYAEPDYKLKLCSTFPNDTYFDSLWAMYNYGEGYGTVDADIDAPEAWDIVTDSHIIVAVIDSGIDYNHPDLAENIWINEAELNGLPGEDDDNNGYIDDIRGWNFDPDVNDNDPMDLYGHGTHIAGIIGAVGNNDRGVTGVCWNVKMMAVTVTEFEDEEWAVFASSAVKGINYAVKNGAKVINASWGGKTPIQALEDAIEAADNNGVLVIAAADYFTDMDDPRYYLYPACYPHSNIISVLATNNNDNICDYSSYGHKNVDLGAPGGDFLYSWLSRLIYSTIPGGGYGYKKGTSMATPHVTGACALVWAANPKLSHYQVRQAILESVDVLPSLSGKCVTGGRLNLYKAINKFPIPVRLTITDDANGCASPNDTITYRIHYDPNGFSDTNVEIIDELPTGVEYGSSNPSGYYNTESRTITWDILSFGPNNPNDINLTVIVTEAANPGSTITNICQIIGDSFHKSATAATCVDCWAGERFYVNDNASVGGNGRGWGTAFNNLQTAFGEAVDGFCPCREIWVAAGTYQPVNDVSVSGWYNYSFELFDGLGLMGHFDGNETDPSQRKLNDVNLASVLDGQISAGNKVYTVVEADGVTDAFIDGFTIKRSYFYSGMKLANDSDVAVINCILRENPTGLELSENAQTNVNNCKFIDNDYGLKTENGTVADIFNCIFENNTNSGIYADGSSRLTLSSCNFNGNNQNCYYGLYAQYIDGLNVAGCTFEEFYESSLYLYDVDLTLTDSLLKSSYGGLFCQSADARINRNRIYDNDTYGFNLQNSNSASITNNWIYSNSDGIFLYYPQEVADIRSNTIVYNTRGIVVNYGTLPNITNCIIWNNGDDLYNCNATFSCIKNLDSGDGVIHKTRVL